MATNSCVSQGASAVVAGSTSTRAGDGSGGPTVTQAEPDIPSTDAVTITSPASLGPKRPHGPM